MEIINNNPSRMKTPVRVILLLLFLLYLAGLFKIILLKYLSLSQFFSFNTSLYRSCNLVPFRSISEYQQIGSYIGFLRWAGGTFGNLIVFIPMGWFIPLLFPSKRPFLRVLLVSGALSIFMEVLQYVTSTGSADIDDLILNLAGSSLGYLWFYILTVILGRGMNLVYAIILFFLVFTGAAAWVMFKEYGLILGLVKTKFITVGGKEIPPRQADIGGVYSELTGDTLFFDSFQRMSGNQGNQADTDLMGSKSDFVLLSPQTKVFRKTSDYEDYVVTDSIHPATAEELKKAAKGSATLSIWRQTSGNQEIASVVAFYLMPMGQGSLRSSVMMSGAKAPSPAKTTQLDSEQALALVSNSNAEPEMTGTILEIRGDSLIIDRVISRKLPNGTSVSFMTAKGSKNYNRAKVKLMSGTYYFSQFVRNAGKSPSVIRPLQPGHLKVGDFINCFGEEKDRVLNAAVISVMHFDNDSH